MTKWRRVGAVVVLGSISSVAACATATNNGAPGAGASAGTNDGTSGASSGFDGSPTGGSAPSQAGATFGTAGAPGAGAPSSAAGAATGGSSTGGSATGGSSTGGSATAGASTGGSAGHAGAIGAAGAATGGSSGTSSGGGPGVGDGGILTGACANPIDVVMGKSGNFGTTSAVCYRTTETFNTIGCSNFDGRTIKVNGMLATCNVMKATFAAAVGGYNYFDVSAGTLSFASFVWYTS